MDFSMVYQIVDVAILDFFAGKFEFYFHSEQVFLWLTFQIKLLHAKRATD